MTLAETLNSIACVDQYHYFLALRYQSMFECLEKASNAGDRLRRAEIIEEDVFVFWRCGELSFATYEELIRQVELRLKSTDFDPISKATIQKPVFKDDTD